MERSLAFIKLNCNVRGIGVAVSVRVSTLTFIFLSWSFTPTPNFCSSSIINRPRSLNITSLPISLWVPIKISIFPFFKYSKVFLMLLDDLNLFI